MHASDAVAVTAHDRRRRFWPANALLTLGAWLVVSPLVLGTLQVTAGVVVVVSSGVALIILSVWLRRGRNPVPPLLVALAFGGWLLLAPSLWEFADGWDAWPLVPIPPSEIVEPTRAMVARAEWNSILAGLLALALAGSVLAAGRRRKGRPARSGRAHRQQVQGPNGRR
jgi:hypothetical protein